MNTSYGYIVSAGVMEDIARCASKEELHKVVGNFMSDIGFGRLTFHLARKGKTSDQLLDLITSYPQEWIDRYIENKYVYADLIHRRSLKSVIPFAWSDLLKREVSKENATIFNEASDFGIIDGFSIPVRGPDTFGVFSALAEGSQRERKETLARGGAALTVIALHMHEKSVQLADRSQPTETLLPLSPREQEGLQWITYGKTGSETADILNITEFTVNKHIRACMEKLDANTRVQAAVKGVIMGLVEPVPR